MRFVYILFLFFLPLASLAQFSFRFTDQIPVFKDGTALSLAWEGGLNAAQFLKMDLNGDDTEDLVIYHRMSRELSTFLAIDNAYVPAPDYVHFFPEEINHWLILADYNCDGLKDIFTSTPLGIRVFRNVTAGEFPAWEEAVGFLTFEGGSNLQVNASDIPGIADIDGDGDLDILTYRFSSASTVEYYENRSMENTGSCEELVFVRETRRWGDFEECGCNAFVFGTTCAESNQVKMPGAVEKTMHAGGKTILPVDIDHDGDMDLVTSDEFCETLYFMENEGDPENARMNSFESFPSSSPAAFYTFPAAFFEDLDHDGVKDLLVSTNIDNNILDSVDFTKTSIFYRNTGTDELPVFTEKVNGFLQEEMIDLGENTYPELADYDADGDLDLLVGNRGLLVNGALTAGLSLYENTGSATNPQWTWVTEDYLALRREGFRNIKPQLVDLDNDGDLDLTFQATSVENNQTQVHYRMNTASAGSPFNFTIDQTFDIPMTESDHPFFYDIDGDGNVDLLIGNQLGALQLMINNGGFAFSEITGAFAGIENDFNRRNLAPRIADVNNDGMAELLTTDLSGEIRIHAGDMGIDFIADSVYSDIILNETRGISETSRLAVQNAFTLGDLYGNGRPMMIIGNNRGGLRLLENLSNPFINNGGRKIELSFSPNPAREALRVFTDVSATLEIFTVTGQLIRDNITTSPNVVVEIQVSSLPAGVYILRASNESQEPTARRILVEK